MENQDNVSHTSRTIGGSTAAKGKAARNRSFHLRYLDLCRSKNMAPVAEIRKNSKEHAALDFFGDKLGVSEWLLIANALYGDQSLVELSIRLRKCLGPVVAQIDTDRKAKLYKDKPVIFTKFVFSELMSSLSNCIEQNKNLRVLNLEGLPLSDSYVETIAKALASSTSLKEISFARSNIYDRGCEVLCNTLKYLDNVEKLNLSDSGLTTKGALYIADMIKIQKISRYTAGWQQSLRYSSIDSSNIPGLCEILLARNPQIGDEGLKAITEVLKEDIWIKSVDMENCGLTDQAANILLDCLKANKFIVEFNIRGNSGISKFLLRSINKHLNKTDECERTGEELLRDFNDGLLNGDELINKHKVSIQQLVTQLKATTEQLALERRVRKKAEELNEKLTSQIMAYENKLQSMAEGGVPDGFVVVKKESLESIIKERDELHKMVESELILRKENSHSPTQTKKLSFKVQEEIEMQFEQEQMDSPAESARSVYSDTKSSRQAGEVRKVKSEMKYVEQTKRTLLKKKETKSDYDYASDDPHFEMNIGDTVKNMGAAQHSAAEQIHTQQLNIRRNLKLVSKHELDEISLSTARSQGSDTISAESETLRHEDIVYEEIKAYKNSKHIPQHEHEHGQGEGSGTAAIKQRMSPRTLFLGLCDK